MKGSYILLIEVDQSIELIVRKNKWFLREDIYAYVGSAMNGIWQRVSRHLRKNKKKHWHIDYLLKFAKIKAVVMYPGKREEELSRTLSKYFEGVQGFGATDLRLKSNLYRVENIDSFFGIAKGFLNQDD